MQRRDTLLALIPPLCWGAGFTIAKPAVTHFPPWRLWAHQVNEQGGLKLKDGQRKVELIEYDDRTQPPEAIKAVERLASVDKVDWIVVKAICDFADGNKGAEKEERQKLAAKSAADFVVQTLQYAPVKRR